jgi:hypothetical protein
MTKPHIPDGGAQDFIGVYHKALDDTFYESISLEDRTLLNEFVDKLDYEKTARSRRKVRTVVMDIYLRGTLFGSELAKAGEDKLGRFLESIGQETVVKIAKRTEKRKR